MFCMSHGFTPNAFSKFTITKYSGHIFRARRGLSKNDTCIQRVTGRIPTIGIALCCMDWIRQNVLFSSRLVVYSCAPGCHPVGGALMAEKIENILSVANFCSFQNPTSNAVVLEVYLWILAIVGTC